jgi:hypothetical protein
VASLNAITQKPDKIFMPNMTNGLNFDLKLFFCLAPEKSYPDFGNVTSISSIYHSAV